MQRLLLLTIVATLAASSTGCRWSSRGAPCTPCVQAPACTPGMETYGPPGTITTVPTMTPQMVPGQLNPGPETYTPSVR